MSLSVFNNSSNSFDGLNFSSMFHSITTNGTCELTAWMNPGHGFVEFNCGEIKEVLGFYPNFFRYGDDDDNTRRFMERAGSKIQKQGTTKINSVAIPSFSSAASIQKRLAR